MSDISDKMLGLLRDGFEQVAGRPGIEALKAAIADRAVRVLGGYLGELELVTDPDLLEGDFLFAAVLVNEGEASTFITSFQRRALDFMIQDGVEAMSAGGRELPTTGQLLALAQEFRADPAISNGDRNIYMHRIAGVILSRCRGAAEAIHDITNSGRCAIFAVSFDVETGKMVATVVDGLNPMPPEQPGMLAKVDAGSEGARIMASSHSGPAYLNGRQ